MNATFPRVISLRAARSISPEAAAAELAYPGLLSHYEKGIRSAALTSSYALPIITRFLRLPAGPFGRPHGLTLSPTITRA